MQCQRATIVDEREDLHAPKPRPSCAEAALPSSSTQLTL
jgi:hypothetical protein